MASIIIPTAKGNECVSCHCRIGSKISGRTKRSHFFTISDILAVYRRLKILLSKNFGICSKCYDTEDFEIKEVKEHKIQETDVSVFNSLLYLVDSKINSPPPSPPFPPPPVRLGLSSLSKNECYECCGLTPTQIEEISLIIQQSSK